MNEFLSENFYDQLEEIEDTDSLVCGQDFKEYLIFEVGVIDCIYVFLGIWVIISKCTFSHVALVSTPIYPLSLKLKIFFQVVMIILFAMGCAFSFLSKNNWIYGCSTSWVGVAYVLPIIILILNIDWLKFQYERKIPLVWYQNQLIWALTSLSYLVVLVSCYLLPYQRFSYNDFVLLALKLFISLILMSYTTRRSQDLNEFMTDSGLRGRLIPRYTLENNNFLRRRDTIRELIYQKRAKQNNTQNVNPDDPTDLSQPPIKVTVANKTQMRENPQTGIQEVTYKIQVQTSIREHKILRTLNDFKRLENSLIPEAQDDQVILGAINSINAVFSDQEVENMSNFSFVVLSLQNFLTTLLKGEHLPSSLLAFLEIPESEHAQLIYTNKRRYSRPMGPAEENDDEEEKRGDENINQVENLEVAGLTEKDYCLYFNVSIPKYKRSEGRDYIEFIINLNLMEKPDEGWQIHKRYSDFIEIRQHLHDTLRIVPPKLPKKLLVITEESQLEERRQGLESWLRIVLNEKIYFVPQLFQFINLNPAYYEWLKEDAYDFSNFKAIIDKNNIIMNQNKPYTMYHIIIEEISDSDGKKKKRVYALYRRYKEFYQLDQALHMRFTGSARKLPELPPKYNAFSNKTTVDSRQQGLQRYLNQLFLYENIGDSFAFRKFINFKRTMDSFVGGKETAENIFNPMEDEAENISNLTIEKHLSTAKNKKH